MMPTIFAASGNASAEDEEIIQTTLLIWQTGRPISPRVLGEVQEDESQTMTRSGIEGIPELVGKLWSTP